MKMKIVKSGCSAYQSQIGFNYKSYELQLSPNCFSDYWIRHQLFHVLGFANILQRRDRDKHVTIKADSRESSNKRKMNFTNNQLVPFDFRSIMWHSPDAWCGPGSNDCVVPVDPSKTIPADPEKDIPNYSENDILMVNKLYNCTNLN